jgi:hypothetical protein
LGFLGSKIFSWKDELRRTGVVVRLEEASRATAQRFKQIVPHSLSDKSKALQQYY